MGKLNNVYLKRGHDKRHDLWNIKKDKLRLKGVVFAQTQPEHVATNYYPEMPGRPDGSAVVGANGVYRMVEPGRNPVYKHGHKPTVELQHPVPSVPQVKTLQSDTKDPPGYTLREKYGLRGAGYYKGKVAPKIEAAHKISNQLVPSILSKLGISVDSDAKDLIKKRLYKYLKHGLGPHVYNKSAKHLMRLLVRLKGHKVVGGHAKLNELASNLGSYMLHYAEAQVEQQKEDKRERKARAAEFGREFYKGFAMVMKPGLKILAPMAELIGPEGIPIAMALEAISEMMPAEIH